MYTSTLFYYICVIFYYVCVLLCGSYVEGILWKNGIIHYSINNKDYDAHSQEIILSTLSQLQEMMCVKFFPTAPDHRYDKVLYINNPDKRKACPKNVYDFRKSIVDMPIGYKCLNQKDIARIVVEMLRASIDSNGMFPSVNSGGLVNGFPENGTETDIIKSPLISSWERNYINSKYKSECGLVTVRPPLLPTLRRQSAIDDVSLSDANVKYYNKKLWPLGIFFYGFVKESVQLKNFNESVEYFRQAMNLIERLTCIVFQEVDLNDAVLPNRVIRYVNDEKKREVLPCGADAGQSCLARSLRQLFSYLGVPFMSNRFDRDNYVTINWKKARTENLEHLFEKEPEDAWIVGMPYDFNSVSHPPANYHCKEACYLGDNLIRPIQDHLWQREMSMGHAEVPSENDIKIIDMLYGSECRKRFKK